MDSCEDCGEIHHPEDMLTPDADEWPEVAGMVYCRFCWEHIENEIINERWLVSITESEMSKHVSEQKRLGL